MKDKQPITDDAAIAYEPRLCAGQIRIYQKAFRLNLDKIEEGFLHAEYTCLAKNRNEAKVKMSQLLRYEDMKLKYTDTEMTYLNMPIVRYPEGDKVWFENEIVSRFDIDNIIRKRERLASLQAILDDPNTLYCYIMKRGEYYRPGSAGYTGFMHRAGVYSKQEAVSDGKSCEDLRIIPIDISTHNIMIEKEIADLRGRLLPCT